MTLGQQKKRVKVAIGHDHGNTETADYVIYAPELPAAGRVQPLQAIALPPGKIVQKTFPSAVAEGSKEELESLRVGAGRTAQSKGEELVISVNGGPEQFVGLLAQRQARQAFTGRGDIHRYESERSLITLLAGLGSLVEEEEIEAWVVTGLPVETFQKGKAIRRGAKGCPGRRPSLCAQWRKRASCSYSRRHGAHGRGWWIDCPGTRWR